MVLENLSLHTEENEAEPLPHTKTWLRLDQSPTCKSWVYTAVRRKHRCESGNGFSHTTPKAWARRKTVKLINIKECASKNTIEKVKKTTWSQNILSSHVSDDALHVKNSHDWTTKTQAAQVKKNRQRLWTVISPVTQTHSHRPWRVAQRHQPSGKCKSEPQRDTAHPPDGDSSVLFL